MSVTRLTTRDYKRTQRRTMDVSRFREFGMGALVGVVLATSVFVYIQDAEPAPETEQRPEPRRTEPAEADPAVADPAEQLEFYEMLPNFEVVVPEKEQDVKRDVPAARIERPGVYVLQVGSYRNLPDAERMRAQLALQGITARIQRVSVDSDVWHRVRIGPIRDLDELNRVRRQLQAAEIEGLLIRVGD